MKLDTKNEKAITLISLVITIIILLILAGISISQLAANGLLGKAKFAKEENKRASIIEYINLKLNELVIDNYDKDNDEFINIANNEFKKEDVKNDLKQYGKEIVISDVIGSDNNKFFYITIDNKIYEVKRTGATYRGESIEVGKPAIEVVSGTEGDNGYYRSDVELKITQINTDNLYKIKYKLEGVMTTEEKEIENGGTISITKEGTTTITVASYDYTNNKSEDVELEIKKDSIAPEIELSDANPSAREYNKTVRANITDATSSVVSKKYAYNTRNINYFSANGSGFVNDFTVRTQDEECSINHGPSKICTVYAKDEAGNESVNTISLPNLLISNVLTGKNGLAAMDGYIDESTGAITFTSTGGTQFGPYWALPSGTYEIMYSGSNISTNAANYGTYSNSNVAWNGTEAISMVVATANYAVYRVTIPYNVTTAEFVFWNNGRNNLTINNIKITQL